MYKYMRDLMNVADLVGDVDDLNWFKLNGQEWIVISGKSSDGKKFELRLEVEKDGD